MLLEFVLPTSVQTIAIAALLFLAKDSALYTLLAIILSLVWLKVTHNRAVQEAGEIRARRRLFAALGAWNAQENPEQLFDDVMAECLMIGPIDDEDTWAMITAWGMANAVRGALSVLLQLYMLVTVALSIASALGS
ncbi:MAG: hypothetical protein EA371_08805 [Gammaproteobacteria bacterium]|nr:MAG: hypothetical protein EA371_08805 [Gammaproteobacteria bacterium]